MITEKAIMLCSVARRKKDTRLSDLAIDELLDNCKPTQDEFSNNVDRIILSAKSLYRLTMEAKDKWSN